MRAKFNTVCLSKESIYNNGLPRSLHKMSKLVDIGTIVVPLFRPNGARRDESIVCLTDSGIIVMSIGNFSKLDELE